MLKNHVINIKQIPSDHLKEAKLWVKELMVISLEIAKALSTDYYTFDQWWDENGNDFTLGRQLCFQMVNELLSDHYFHKESVIQWTLYIFNHVDRIEIASRTDLHAGIVDRIEKQLDDIINLN